MDIGDILFLLIMGLGFLSSIGGAKKKKKRKGQLPPKPRPSQGGSPPKPVRKSSRLQEARERALSQMEELLRDIEGGGKPPSEPRPEARTSLPDVIVESQDTDLPPPVPVARELPPSVPAPRDGTLHEMFHDKYIQPVAELEGRASIPRSNRHLSPNKLREAVLLREILGPPKGLQ